MTGYRSKDLRHSCPTDGCYVEKLPCWDDFNEAYPRAIRPTDIDGVVEINGSFLFLEEKGPGVPLQFGQMLMFRRLAERPNVTVVVFRPMTAGTYDDGLEIYVLPKPAMWEPVTAAQFKARIKAWADRADSRAVVGMTAT